MMSNNETTTTAVAPRRVIASAWVLLCCLIVLFAGDINSWAVSADDTPVVTTLRPVAGAVDTAVDAVGLGGLKDALSAGPLALYANSPEWAARGEATEEAVAVTPAVPETAAVVVDTPQPETVAATVPAKPRPERVLIIGDSNIESGLGTVLEELWEKCEGVTVLRYGQHSTGLARPDYFDWSVKLAELQEEFDPDLVIAYFGDNDCQGLSTLEGAFITKFGTEEWDQVYGERVTALVTQMRETGGSAAMIGMPIMRSSSFSRKVERLNGVLETATEGVGGVYLPTWGITSDEEGKYVASVEFDGRDRMIRAGDGIHFSSHGSAYVADGLMKMLMEHFEIEMKEE